MQKCLDLAKKGLGQVTSNPMVGCIIVYKNEVIGEGYHQKYGHAHAEVNAIQSVKNKKILSKSTLYVNLEPCAHLGKTPPCADMIIDNKIPNVVIGCVDTFSEVSGRGIAKMRKNGVNVKVNILEKESREVNKRFFTFHEKKRPYIILKWAKSLDGYIAPFNQNKPFWMTCQKSKELVHKWRTEEDAILIGRVTAQKDNPMLTSRYVNGTNPIRIVIDKELKLSSSLNIFNNEVKTIIFNNHKDEEKNKNIFIKIDFKYLIKNILNELYKQKIQSLIIEGGNKTLQSFIDNKIWDEARVFTANLKLNNGLKSPIFDAKTFSCSEIEKDRLSIYINV